jgi:hypothetical protein
MVAGPADGHAKENFWLHSWTYLIPFPPPVVRSTFAYSFDVPIEVATLIANGSVTFSSFVSVGETPNFVGQEVVVNTLDSWPLATNLSGPCDEVLGQSNVLRSFVVEGGHVPAVALALGLVVALESGSEVQFQEPVSFIYPWSSSLGVGGPGLVDFRYEPAASCHTAVAPRDCKKAHRPIARLPS